MSQRSSGSWVRRLVAVLVVVAVLGGGAVVAAPVLDDAVRHVTERQVAEQVVRETGATGRVEVTIGGRWFVPQALRGHYPRVRLDARGLPAQGLRLERVVADLVDVTIPLSEVLGGTPRVQVASSRAQVELAYPVLNGFLREQGRSLVVAPEPGGGQLRVTGSTELLGREVALSGIVGLEVEGSELRAVPDQLDTDNALLDRLSRTVLRGLRDQLAFSVPLGELPFAQQVTRAQVRSTGIVVTTQGADVVVGG